MSLLPFVASIIAIPHAALTARDHRVRPQQKPSSRNHKAFMEEPFSPIQAVKNQIACLHPKVSTQGRRRMRRRRRRRRRSSSSSSSSSS